MAKLIRCPNCSKGNSKYLMIRQNKSEYDEELHMPIIIYVCGICRTKMKVTALVCVDCGGHGEHTYTKDTTHGRETGFEYCSHCDGLGIIPKKFEIIPGNRPRKRSTQLHEELGISEFDLREFIAADNKYRGFSDKRGDPFGDDW